MVTFLLPKIVNNKKQKVCYQSDTSIKKYAKLCQIIIQTENLQK